MLLEAYTEYLARYGSWIGPGACFGGDPVLPHGVYGIFISDGARIGKDCVIFHQVTIGSNTLAESKGAGAPVIGDNCLIGAGAKIIGGVKVGNNCRIGANCVVYRDIPNNSVAVLSETRVIQKKALDNRYSGWEQGPKKSRQ
jgi:serine O-acetyltransferase